MDESPRWLIVSGQYQRAKRILQKAARWNKVTLPPDDQLDDLFSRISKEEAKEQQAKQQQTRRTSVATCYKGCSRPRLFWNKNITVITLITALCYFCVALVFDGLNLAGDIYSDNIYLYLVFGGLAEIPGSVFTAPLVHRLGRNGPLVACLFGCGLVNLAIPILPAEHRVTTFVAAMVGKLLVTAAFNILYLYSSELFPTDVRVSGVEGANAVGQVGAVFAPYCSTYLGPLVPWLPSVVYGIISIITAIATWFLPETKDMALAETIADLQHTSMRKLRKREMSDGDKEDNEEPDASTALREEPC